MEPMVEQEVKPVTPEQPHAVATEAPPLVEQPERTRGVWFALSMIALGALLALGAMWVFTRSQGMHAASPASNIRGTSLTSYAAYFQASHLVP